MKKLSGGLGILWNRENLGRTPQSQSVCWFIVNQSESPMGRKLSGCVCGGQAVAQLRGKGRDRGSGGFFTTASVRRAEQTPIHIPRTAKTGVHTGIHHLGLGHVCLIAYRGSGRVLLEPAVTEDGWRAPTRETWGGGVGFQTPTIRPRRKTFKHIHN